MTNQIEKAGMYNDVPEADYFADPCPMPSFTQSLARTLLSQSPRHAAAQHPRIDAGWPEIPIEPSSTRDIGSAIHSLAFNNGENITVIDEDNYLKKTAKAQRDVAYEDGKIPILAKVYEPLPKAVDLFITNIKNLFDGYTAHYETVICWQGDSGVWRRGKLDALFIDEQAGRAFIFDLKTTMSEVDTHSCHSNLINCKGFVQAAAYIEGVSSVTGIPEDNISFIWQFMRQKNYYELSSIIEADVAMLEIATNNWRRACAVWDKCYKADKWPDYQERKSLLSPPHWLMCQESEIEEI